MSRDYDIEMTAWRRFWAGERIDALTCSVMTLTLDRIRERQLAIDLDVLTIGQAIQFVGVDARTLGRLSITNESLRPVQVSGLCLPVFRRSGLQKFIDELPALAQ